MKKIVLLFFVILGLKGFSQDIQSNMVVYLPFNGDAKDQVTLKTGTFDASFVSFSDGKFGKAANFAGGSGGSYVVFKESDFSLPMGNSAYSISLWIKTKSADNLGMLITWGVNGITSGSNNQLVQFCANNNGTVRSGLWGNDFDVTVDVNTGEWVNVVTTYGNKLCAVYVNGALISSGALPNFAEPAIAPDPYGMWTVGALNSPLSGTVSGKTTFGSWSAYNGIIDDVRIYSRALTANDVAALYAYNPASSAPLLALHKNPLKVIYKGNALEITFEPKSSQEVVFSLFNIEGKLLKIKKASSSAGTQQTAIETQDLQAGIYLLKSNIDGIAVSQKVAIR